MDAADDQVFPGRKADVSPLGLDDVHGGSQTVACQRLVALPSGLAIGT